MDYGEVIQVLERANEDLEFPVNWGIDLQSELERCLTEKYAKKPVIVMNYPKAIKAFYMRLNDDGKGRGGSPISHRHARHQWVVATGFDAVPART